MKIFYFGIILICFSCSTMKFRENELDTTQELRGKIKSIHFTNLSYSLEGDHELEWTDSLEVYYGAKNRLDMELLFLKKDTVCTKFIYNRMGLLDNSITTYLDRTGRSIKAEYLYDEHGNLIEYNTFENGNKTFKKTFLYDSFNNKVEENYFISKTGMYKFVNDYKTNTVTAIRDSDTIFNKNYSKSYYDKKGYVIRIETIQDKKVKNAFTFKYDKKGNLLKSTIYNDSNIQEPNGEYKNVFDSKGNIVKRDEYLNGRLINSSLRRIEYY